MSTSADIIKYKLKWTITITNKESKLFIKGTDKEFNNHTLKFWYIFAEL